MYKVDVDMLLWKICQVGLFLIITRSAEGNTFGDAKKLLDFLSQNNTKYIRPVLNQTEPVYVRVFVNAYKLMDFDVANGRLSLLSTFVFNWTDENKAWTPSLFNGIEKIHLPKSSIWVPNILIDNSADLKAILQNDDLPQEIEIRSSGNISFYTSVVFEILCDPDIEKYPFDQHECEITFITDRSNTDVKLRAYDPIDTSLLKENGIWEVTPSWFDHKLTRGIISSITFRLILKRYATFQVTNFVMPVIILVALNLLVFILPPDSGERISFSITIMLSFVVFLSAISDRLPETNKPVCLFNIYLVMQLIYSGLISTSVIAVSWMHHKADGKPVPAIVRAVFGKRKATGVHRIRIGANGRISPDDDGPNVLDSSATENGWKDVAINVDKCFFYVFTVFAFLETLIVLLLMIHIL